MKLDRETTQNFIIAKSYVELQKLRKQIKNLKKARVKKSFEGNPISQKEYELNCWLFNFQMRLAQFCCLSVLAYFSWLKWFY